MQEFIESAASRLGIDQDQAKSATASVLKFLKDQAAGPEVDALIAKIPGAENLIQSTASSGEGGGGILGALGGNLGATAGVMAALQKSGLDGGRAKSFITMLIDYAKQKAGPEQVERVLDKLPAVKSFLQ